MAGIGYGATVGLTALGVAAAGPIVAGALALVGIGFGIATIVRGASAAKDATSDAEAKYAWENIGTGTAIVGLSTAAAVKSVKGIIKEYKNIEVESAPQLQKEMLKALDKAKYDKSVVADMMKEHPEFIEKIAQYKGPDGKPLFSPAEINDILYNLRATIEQNPEKIFAILNNPDEVAEIAGWKNHGAGLWRAVGDPLESTIEANPELFGRTAAPATAETASAAGSSAETAAAPKQLTTEFIKRFDRCRSVQDLEALVKQTRSEEECLYIVNRLDNPNTKAVNTRAIEQVISMAQERAHAFRGVSVESVTKYLSSRTNFDNVEGVYRLVSEHPEYIERLAALRNADGTACFNEARILYDLFDRNYEAFSTNPEQVFAILENPEELSGLFNTKYGFFESGKLYRAIKHPLSSTRQANPGLFVPEPEVNVQSVTQALQEMVTKDPAFKAGGVRVLEQHPELVEQLASLRTSDGHVFMGSEDIAGFLCNIAEYIGRPGYINNLLQIMNDPVQMGYVEGYMSPGFGLWRISIGG